MSLFIVFLLSARAAEAQQDFFNERKTYLNFLYTQYAGEKYKSLGKTSTSLGGEIQLRTGNKAFGIVTSAAGMYGSGTEEIMDGATAQSLKVTFMACDVNLGIYFNLMPSKDFSFRPYVAGLATAELVSMRLPANGTYTDLDVSQISTLTGYQISLGADITRDRSNRTKNYSLNGEVRYRFISGPLLKVNTFKLDGLTLMVGLGF